MANAHQFPHQIPHPFANGLGIQSIPHPPAHNMTGRFDTSDDDESHDGRSDLTVRLNIHCPLIIKGDNNLIALDPSMQASKIAMEVVDAMKELSSAKDGLPMIDEDGRPRPVRVEIHAEITIDGARNVIGEKAVMTGVSGLHMKRKVEDGNDVKELKDVKDVKDVRKREREDSELVDVDAKRAKN